MNNKQLYLQRSIVFEDDSFIELQETEYQKLLKELEKYNMLRYYRNLETSGCFESIIYVYNGFTQTAIHFKSDYIRIIDNKLYFNPYPKFFKELKTSLQEVKNEQ